jgi:hypothetical protein
MKMLDNFLLRLIIGLFLVLLFHNLDFTGFLQGLEEIYINLARTIDPGYTLTLIAENTLIWIAGVSALWFVYR